MSKTKSGKSKTVKAPDPPEKSIEDRYERRSKAFARLSAGIAAGKYLVPPKFLEGQARRLHVRTTIREDHSARISESSKEAQDKFDKLSDGLFHFSAVLRFCSIAIWLARMATCPR